MHNLTNHQKKILNILQEIVNSDIPLEMIDLPTEDLVNLHEHKHWELTLRSKNDNGIFNLLRIVHPGEKHQSMLIEDMQKSLVLGIGRSLLDCSYFSNSIICSYEYSEEGDLICSHLEQLERWKLCNAPQKLLSMHGKLLIYEIKLLLQRNFFSEINLQCRSTLAIATRYIRLNYSNRDLTVNRVAQNTGCSSEHLCRLFKRTYGTNIREYIINMRLIGALELLSDNILTIVRIASLTGWKSANYFARVFKQKTGITASEFALRCSHLNNKEGNYLEILSQIAPDLLDFLKKINNKKISKDQSTIT